jgi:hypothetical protein
MSVLRRSPRPIVVVSRYPAPRAFLSRAQSTADSVSRKRLTWEHRLALLDKEIIAVGQLPPRIDSLRVGPERGSSLNSVAPIFKKSHERRLARPHAFEHPIHGLGKQGRWSKGLLRSRCHPPGIQSKILSTVLDYIQRSTCARVAQQIGRQELK